MDFICGGLLGLLLGREDFRFLLLAQRDVGEADHRAHDRAVLQHRGGAILDRQARAVLAPQELVVDAAGLAVLVGGVHRAFFLRILAAVGPVVVEGGVGRLPDQFLGGEPEHPAGGGVHERDASLGVRAEDALGAGFEDEPRALLADLELFPLRGQLALLRQQFLLLRQQFLLRLRQLLGLLLELAGLFLGLGEQFLRAEVALQDLQAHRHHRQQFLEQRLLPRVERAEGGDLQHAQQRVLRTAAARPRPGPARPRPDRRRCAGSPAADP